MNDTNMQVIEKDCFKLDKGDLNFSDFDVYLFDGPHEMHHHEAAITQFSRFLSNLSIIIIDDWNWQNVREGTFRGLSLASMRPLYFMEIKTDSGNDINYWNGVCIFVVQKIIDTQTDTDLIGK